MKNLRNIFKKIVFNTPLLRKIFILVYKIGGRKPWSMGYSVYKFSQIKSIIKSQPGALFQNKLPENYGSGLDERVVEYPWFFSRLKSSAKKILDAGSTLNHVDILSADILKDRKIYISTLSYEDLPKVDVVPSYVFEDMRDTCYKNEFFDAIVCISTLEHVGMDNTFLYTDDKRKHENDKYAYLSAVRELKRVLKKGGSLYLTMPYGRYSDHNWFQVFDADMVMQLKEEFSPSKIDETYFKYGHEQWNYSDAKACRDGYYYDVRNEGEVRKDRLAAAQSVVCLEMVK